MNSKSNLLLGISIFVLLTGLPANMSLMWLLLSSKKALSASEVLGLNLSILDILYCLCLPLNIYIILHQDVPKSRILLAEAFSALNVFGCPLLLTCMCLERFMAVAAPLAHMKLGNWKYRAAMCTFAWLLTLLVALLAYNLRVFNVGLYLGITISVLFLIMLLCLAGIVWVLCKAESDENTENNVSLKRKVLKNVLALTVPTLVAYTPLVALVPYLRVVYFQQEVTSTQCCILEFLLAFPNFGTYIGPVFYLSRFWQLACCKKAEDQSPKSNTQVE